ncbi:MAG: hypothetical protein RL368_1031, partial [Pseudomonadota bacterium]
MRKLGMILASMSTLFSLDTYALGLSNIEVGSKLNEPLNAKINILSIPKGDIDNINILIPTEEAFRRAGLERPRILDTLKFTIEPVTKTEAVIRVSTTQPLKEPFLNFLIEVNWPSGRILRE